MSENWYNDVMEFHTKAKQVPYPFKPKDLTVKIYQLRKNLINEEKFELFSAMAFSDLTNIADGIIDLIVVLIGTAIAYGIDLNPIWDEIHKTNMAKFNDGLNIDKNGKVLKPKNWIPPNIEKILKKQGWKNENSITK